MDDPTQKYISRAIDLAAETDDALTEGDLADIALELGLTDEDLARVEQAIDDHVERGRGYARHGMWDDAIRELREAAALAPRRLEVQLTLAEALAGRAEATDFPDDAMRATDIARRVLKRDPGNDRAYQLIADVEGVEPAATPRGTGESGSPRANQPKIILFVMGGLVAAGMVMVTVLVFLYLAMSPSTPETPEVPEPVVTTTDDTTDELPRNTGDRELPLEFVDGSDVGLEFRERKSRFSVYPGSAYYRIWGEFEVTGDVEVEQIDVKLELLDEGGSVVKADTFEAWAGHEATLRKGDTGSWAHLLEGTAAVESARLSVTLVDSTPSGGKYAKAKPIEPEFLVKPPDHFNLVIRERRAELSSNDFMDGGYFKAEWEFHNAGDVPIKALKYEVRLFDAKGTQLAVSRKIATYSSHPPLLAGQTFVESEIERVSDVYDHYEIAIVELE